MLTVEEDAARRVAEVLVPGPARDALLELAPEAMAILPLRGTGRSGRAA